MTATRRTVLASAAALAATPLTAYAQAPSSAGAPSTSPALLRTYLDRLATTRLDLSPETATALGLDTGERARQKRLLDDRSLPRREADKARHVQELAQLQATPKAALSGPSAVDYAVMDDVLSHAVADDRRFAWGDGPGQPYAVDQLNGAWAGVPDFLDTQHVIATPEDADAYLARLSAFGAALDQDEERSRHDAGQGVSPPAFAIDKAIAQIKTLRDTPLGEASLVQSVVRRTRENNIPGDWATPATAIYRQNVLPALDRQIALLTDLRKTASNDAGVWRLPDGPEFYAASLRAQTTSSLSPKEVHKLGLDLVAALSSELDTLFRAQGMSQGTSGQRLHALFADPRFIAPNTDAGKAKLIADGNAKLHAVQSKLPRYFGVLPKAGVEIRAIPKATELSASTHYQAASLDGSRPGIYWLNLRDTAETPVWDLWTTTFHEAIPGHHLQISISQEAPLPLIRKMQGFNAYVEGWALYAEQLAADEMGMYADDPFGRIGYLHDALLRAVRLVIDAGVHDQKWTRERAIRYFADTLGDPEGAAVSEVERYCVWPGQACGYMVGKITWLRARERAKARLGARFDIRRFHDAGLTAGSMPLSVLDRVLDAYV